MFTKVMDGDSRYSRSDRLGTLCYPECGTPYTHFHVVARHIVPKQSLGMLHYRDCHARQSPPKADRVSVWLPSARNDTTFSSLRGRLRRPKQSRRRGV
jgi:hypothetical protein